MRRILVHVLVVSVFLLPLARARGGTQPIVTSDLLRLRSVSSIDVARDGSRAVFAVRSIATLPPGDPTVADADPTYKYRSNLFLLDLANDVNAPPRQITFGDRQDTQP